MSKHPANNHLVQELLRRASWHRNDYFRSRGLLKGARTIADLDVPMAIRHLNSVTQVASLAGVGKGIARIINDTSDEATIDFHVACAMRFQPYDDVEELGRIVRTTAKAVDSNTIVSLVGQHRLGAPYSRHVHIMLTHPNAALTTEAVMSGTVPTMARLLRAMSPHFRDMESTRHPQSLCLRITLPGQSQRRLLSLHWADYSAHAARLLIATGPVDFVSMMILHAAMRGVRLDEQGLTTHDGHRIVADGETHLFRLLNVKYVEPIDRGTTDTLELLE